MEYNKVIILSPVNIKGEELDVSRERDTSSCAVKDEGE